MLSVFAFGFAFCLKPWHNDMLLQNLLNNSLCNVCDLVFHLTLIRITLFHYCIMANCFRWKTGSISFLHHPCEARSCCPHSICIITICTNRMYEGTLCCVYTIIKLLCCWWQRQKKITPKGYWYSVKDGLTSKDTDISLFPSFTSLWQLHPHTCLHAHTHTR